MPYPVAACRGKAALISSGGAAWSPTDLAGLQVWLDGSDISYLYQDAAKTTPVAADGDPVGAWADKSGNGNDVTQAVVGSKPTYKTGIKNGLSILRFDGGDYLRGAFAGALSQPFHYFAVAQLDAAVVNNNSSLVICDGDDAANRVLMGQVSSTNPDEWDIYSGSWDGCGTASDANWHYWSGYFNDLTSELRLDGAATEGPTAHGNKNPDGLTVGCNYNNSGAFWTGDISELLIYDPALSDADRNTLEAWLASKWSI